jgi:hypothetical protein
VLPAVEAAAWAVEAEAEGWAEEVAEGAAVEAAAWAVEAEAEGWAEEVAEGAAAEAEGWAEEAAEGAAEAEAKEVAAAAAAGTTGSQRGCRRKHRQVLQGGRRSLPASLPGSSRSVAAYVDSTVVLSIWIRP